MFLRKTTAFFLPDFTFIRCGNQPQTGGDVMPLLVSPMDQKTPMQQLNFRGVEIDRCPVSGGVWLDAGELEKLLSTVQIGRASCRERV